MSDRGITTEADYTPPAPEAQPQELNGHYRPIEEKPKLTDRGNAMRLARQHGQDLHYCWPWKKWLVWDGRRWRIDDSGEPARRAKEVVAQLYREVSDRLLERAGAKDIGDTEADDQRKGEIAVLKKVLAWAHQSESAPRLSAMLELARSEPGIPLLHTDLDRDPFLLNCTNGTLDLRTGKLRDHCREDLITKLCPTAYRPEATCPTWMRFLTEIFPATGDAAEEPGDRELIDYNQRLLGYCLTGDVREQVLPIFWGDGANGKSTLLNVVQAVVGSNYSMKATPNLLMTRKGEAHPTERADLFGQRMVVAIETEAGGRLAEAMVKELTGGDPIRARRMREDFWEFLPTHKVILCTNHKPKIVGTDTAIWRRPRLVPFVATFIGAKQDKMLPKKLAAEAEGILAWMVRGCLDWLQNGLGTAVAVTLATEEYRKEQDAVGDFFRERCVTGNREYRCKADNLYAAFRKWCEETGEKAVMDKRDFYKTMRTKDFIEPYQNNGTWFRGIGLQHDGTENSWGGTD